MPEIPITDDSIITGDEMTAHLVYVEKALNSVRRDVRRRALMDGFVRFGTRFAVTLGMLVDKANHEGPLEELMKESQKLLTDWMLGKQLTKSVDEADRRAQMAMSLLQEGSAQLGRLAARCIMALPEDHPDRDTRLVHQTLSRYLESARSRHEVDDQVLAITDIVEFRLEPDHKTLELIQQGLLVVDQVSDPDFRHDFRVNVIGYYVSLGGDESNDSKLATREPRADKARKILDQMRAEDAGFFTTDAGLSLAALVMERSGDHVAAASLFGSVVDSSDPRDSSHQRAAIIEAHYRLELKDHARVVKILSPIVSLVEQNYLTSLTDREIAASGVEFSETVWNLAFAHAHLGHWDEAERYLEWGKSLRFRYTAALRHTRGGKRLLKLDRKLYALSRGVPVEAPEFHKKKSEDWLGAGIPLKSKVLEGYRTGRPKVSSELLASPSIREVAETLKDDEAVVTIGVHNRCGTMMVVICSGDTEQPAGHFLWKDWLFSRWVPAFAGDNQDGWLFVLGAPEINVEPRPALTRLLNQMEKPIGRSLDAFLKRKRVRRITIVPHFWFHLVPFWALRSLEKYEITMAASIAHFMQPRHKVGVKGRKALIVADPTRDLPASLAEAEAVETHLSKLGFGVQRLERETAIEDAIVRALRGVSVFHFCGHGRSDSDNPSRSALLLYPDLPSIPAAAKEPFEHFSSVALEWKTEGDNERSTLIPKFGRLYERLIPENQTMERRIEYGERGTLWGRYKDGELKQMAELWSAGDILIEGSLSDCRLVFLSACETGGGNLSTDVDEYSGLPAALQLAGASTIICSLWPISDALTTLYVDLFYKLLARHNQPANAAAIVRKLGSRLRRMKKKQAAALLRGLRRNTSSSRARFILEVYESRIIKGRQFPFSHPYDWAAFYVTGASDVLFPKEGMS